MCGTNGAVTCTKREACERVTGDRVFRAEISRCTAVLDQVREAPLHRQSSLRGDLAAEHPERLRSGRLGVGEDRHRGRQDGGRSQNQAETAGVAGVVRG